MKYCHVWLLGMDRHCGIKMEFLSERWPVQEHLVTWDSMIGLKGLPFPGPAPCVTPNGVPSRLDVLELGGTNGERDKPGREKNIGPQKDTWGQEQAHLLGCKKLQEEKLPWGLSDSWAEKDSLRGRRNSISLKREKKERIFAFWKPFFLSLVIISMFSGMKCLKTTNQHTQTLFFSFATTLKNTVCCYITLGAYI